MKNLIIGICLFLLHMPSVANCQMVQNGCTSEYRFDGKKIILSEKEWKEQLTPEQFRILRQGKTEKPFENAYFDNTRPGIYECAGCLLPLFSSKTKYKSGTGWPSFWSPICLENVTLKKSLNPFSSAQEVLCSRCGGHIGEVFDDGPPPTGKRYCMNSAALAFIFLNGHEASP